jgi:hypothetical protein
LLDSETALSAFTSLTALAREGLLSACEVAGDREVFWYWRGPMEFSGFMISNLKGHYP